MDVSSFVLLSHEQALRRRLDVAANNMANTNTVGFKREQPLFHEYVEQASDAPIEDAKKTSFVLDFGAIHDTTQGAFQATGNPLDVMIDGPGYLSVQTPGGVAYTRAGFVKVLQSGVLATSSGDPLLDDKGRTITVPTDQQNRLTITADGSVMGPDGVIGRLGVTSFSNEAIVTPRGDGMMAGTGGRVLTPAETHLKSGGVEASNVEPIAETTKMVEILRAYQTSQAMSQSLDDLRHNAIQRLGKVN
ncbi:flagellar hook-basal body complex protein [Sphingomonas sp. PR090111-T3T-6A]|uniref:flagellar hook-basal body complex protein n=1 Tax=Sphingomonas sp. PR090111-T3T-6A TaxID=685778 RepID=UPI0003730BD1|nr:flagellar hook-basal body complex protein [Sphingomonas sp. PR090111-T3T-6A]